VIRKHTRRAAKAAFAISIGVALILGLFAAAFARTAEAKPVTVVLGTKNFPEQFILGELYRQALVARGYTVKYKENIGSTELIHGALSSGKINMYPEYTGVVVQNVYHQVSPKTAHATFLLAKKLEAKKKISVLNPTPFYDTDVVAVTNATAQKFGLKTIGDLRKAGAFKLGGFPECKTRATCFVGYTTQYALKNAEFVPLAGISAYAALDAGDIDAADVFSTDPPLAKPSKYTVLQDPKHVTGFQNVSPLVRTSVVNSLGKPFVQVVDAVSAKLTLKAILAMNKAVIVNKQSPKAVAHAFLKANRLVK
jgi:osmoprotectant transport system substrate-binding protein